MKGFGHGDGRGGFSLGGSQDKFDSRHIGSLNWEAMYQERKAFEWETGGSGSISAPVADLER